MIHGFPLFSVGVCVMLLLSHSALGSADHDIFDSLGVGFLRSKVLIGWKQHCEDDAKIATRSLSSSGTNLSIIHDLSKFVRRKNPRLADALDALDTAADTSAAPPSEGRGLRHGDAPSTPTTAAERVAFHRRRRLETSTADARKRSLKTEVELFDELDTGPRRLSDLDTDQRRDVLMAQLEVLLNARASKTLTVHALTQNDASLQTNQVKISTGIDFDAPISNGNKVVPVSGRSVFSDDPESASSWQERAALTECPDYQHSLLTATGSLHSTFYQQVRQDVVSTPCGLTGEEIVALASALPCVEFAHIDAMRRAWSVQASDDVEKVTPSNSTFEGVKEIQQSSYSLSRRRMDPTEGEAEEEVESAEEEEEAADSEREQDSDRSLFCGGCVVPNDITNEQWHLLSKNSASCNLQKAWAEHTSDRDKIEIAIVDTGFSWHSDLSPNFFENPTEAGNMLCTDGIDNDGNGYIDDCLGWDFGDNSNDAFTEPIEQMHGTAVAAVAAARGENTYGVLGSCPFCKIVPLKIYDSLAGGLTLAAEIAALDYIMRMKFPISNHSYGAYGSYYAEKVAIAALASMDHIFVAAAGNDNCDIDRDYLCTTANGGRVNPTLREQTPCGYDSPNIICVGSSSENGEKSVFSNFGVVSVDFFAPGANIYTAFNPMKSEFLRVDGTSFASPLVAGIAGLQKGRNPGLHHDTFVRQLREASSLRSAFSGLAVAGGILDANLVVSQPDTSGLPPDTTWPKPTQPDGAQSPKTWFSGNAPKTNSPQKSLSLLLPICISIFFLIF
eukprot:Selendium_serpulae@DN6177_c6_g1_i10.p1